MYFCGFKQIRMVVTIWRMKSEFGGCRSKRLFIPLAQQLMLGRWSLETRRWVCWRYGVLNTKRMMLCLSSLRTKLFWSPSVPENAASCRSAFIPTKPSFPCMLHALFVENMQVLTLSGDVDQEVWSQQMVSVSAYWCKDLWQASL